MVQMTEKYKYDFLRYNKFHVLKPNFMVILAGAFLAKETFLIVMAMALSFKSRGAAAGSDVFAVLMNKMLLPANLPVLILLWAFSQRNPEGSDYAKKIWMYGRELMVFSASMALAIFYMTNQIYLHLFSVFHLSVAGAYIAVIIYLMTSTFVTDLFKEFPQKSEVKQK